MRLNDMRALIARFVAPATSERGAKPAARPDVVNLALQLAAGLGFVGKGVTPITRRTAICYAPIVRCITLVSGLTSRLVTNGKLKVVDLEGMTVRTPRAQAALELLASSADGGGEPTSNLIKDVMLDYCLDGNGILVPRRVSGRVTGLTRYIRANGDCKVLDSGDVIFNISPAYNPNERVSLPAQDICLVRWGRTMGWMPGQDMRQYGFAPSPLDLLAPSLRIGLLSDEHELEYLKRGMLSRIHFDYNPIEGVDSSANVEQLGELRKNIIKQAQTGDPVVTQNVKAERLDPTDKEGDNVEMSRDLASKIASVYGVPMALMNDQATTWGSGMQVMIRSFLAMSLLEHVNALLDPLALILLGKGQRFEVNTQELMRPDVEDVARLLDAIQGSSTRKPIGTLAELRELAGLSREPDGEFVDQPEPRRNPSGDNTEAQRERTDPDA